MRPGNRRKAGTVTGDPPVRRRLVGGALRRYRENVGYALEDAARTLECDRSKISRIETGQRGIRPKELRELLAEYGVPASEQLALVSIAGRGGQHSWWHPYADTLSDAYLDYVILESATSEIMTYEAQLIPDLLQADDYARAIVAAEPGYVTGQQREDALAAKAARRQAVLSGSRRLSVVLGEGALHQVVGGTDVLAAQISYLARLSDEAPAVTLQVLPFSAGATPARAADPWPSCGFPTRRAWASCTWRRCPVASTWRARMTSPATSAPSPYSARLPSVPVTAHACCGVSRPSVSGPGASSDLRPGWRSCWVTAASLSMRSWMSWRGFCVRSDRAWWLSPSPPTAPGTVTSSGPDRLASCTLSPRFMRGVSWDSELAGKRPTGG